MAKHLPVDILKEAELAIRNAQEVRQFHRKRSEKGDQQREQDLKLAARRLRDAMKPIRSEVGRFPYGDQTEEAEKYRQRVQATSLAIQRERRKLWKMMQKPKRRKRSRR